jgi:hypothetical protein
MKYETLDAALSDPKYSNMKKIVEDSRTYIDAKLTSEYDITNALTFIKTYYFNEKIRAYKKEYTREVFKFLIRELGYDGVAAKMLAKATPLPTDNKMGKIILSFGYGTFIGRVNERHFDTFSFLTGIDKNTALKYTLWGEHASNILAGLQNAALYGTVSLIKKATFGTELNPEESFILGTVYTSIRSAYTYRDQKRFKKDSKYRPYYWSLTTPSGFVLWSLSAYHNLKVKKKQARREADTKHFLKKIFHKTEKQNNDQTEKQNNNKIIKD